MLLFMITACVVGKTDIYRGYELSGSLSKYEQAEIIQRHLDMVNALRNERGLSNLRVSKKTICRSGNPCHRYIYAEAGMEFWV